MPFSLEIGRPGCWRWSVSRRITAIRCRLSATMQQTLVKGYHVLIKERFTASFDGTEIDCKFMITQRRVAEQVVPYSVKNLFFFGYTQFSLDILRHRIKKNNFSVLTILPEPLEAFPEKFSAYRGMQWLFPPIWLASGRSMPVRRPNSDRTSRASHNIA